jgi:hypothetical protein
MKTIIQSLFAAIIALFIFLFNGCEPDQNSTSISEWVELSGTNTSTFTDYISSIATDASGNVYVDAELLNNNNMRYIAKWNKSTNTWRELGGTNTSSFNGGFMAPITTDVFGNIYTCGMTWWSPQVNANYHVAKWDGSTWSELGGTNQPSFNNCISIITTDASGNVYAAGDNIVNGNAPFVAKWDKSTNSWSVLGGSTWFVDCITTDFSGNVYVGGEFLNDNGSPYVAKWDGGTWSELGGTNVSNFGIGNISSIAIDGSGNIYAAGSFINNNDIKNIVKWDKNSNTWSYLSSMIPSYCINSMVIDDSDNLYVAGDPYDSNKKYVSKWNGTSWSDYGNLNANGSIYCISSDANGNVYAGGAFTNGNNKYYVAVYYK